jgi:hypothetical protein
VVADIIPGMYTPQAGIFALGTSSHAYLEFDLLNAKSNKEFASAISAIREPRTTTGGVNFVIGFRPELWRELVPDDAPAGVEGFNKEIQGIEGFVMPTRNMMRWYGCPAVLMTWSSIWPVRSFVTLQARPR